MSHKIHRKFDRDVMYLTQNLTPMEPSGLKIEKLDYVGSSDNSSDVEEQRLGDEHVE